MADQQAGLKALLEITKRRNLQRETPALGGMDNFRQRVLGIKPSAGVKPPADPSMRMPDQDLRRQGIPMKRFLQHKDEKPKWL